MDEVLACAYRNSVGLCVGSIVSAKVVSTVASRDSARVGLTIFTMHFDTNSGTTLSLVLGYSFSFSSVGADNQVFLGVQE